MIASIYSLISFATSLWIDSFVQRRPLQSSHKENNVHQLDLIEEKDMLQWQMNSKYKEVILMIMLHLQK